MVSPILPIAGRGLLNLPFEERAKQSQFQEIAPGLSIAQPQPLQQQPLNVAQASGGEAEIAAGLSILQGAPVGQAIGGLLASKRQAKQDALKLELIRRDEERAVAAFRDKQAAAQRQLVAQKALADFIQNGIPPGDRQNSAIGLARQALAGVEGAGSALAELIANEPIIQNDQFMSRDTVRQIVAEAGGVLDVSVNERQAEAADVARENLKVSQRNASVAERGAALTQRKFTAEQKQRGSTVVGNTIVDLSDPDNPKVKLQVRPARTQKEVSDLENQLRDEHEKASGEFVKVRDAFVRIQSVAETPSAAGDLALIFNFMKMLDPGSTVREGEFATAQNSGGVDDAVVSMYNRVVNGERLSEPQRADFLRQSQNLFEGQAGLQAQNDKQFTDLASRNKVDPRNVVRDLSIPGPSGLPGNAADLSKLSDQEVLERLGIR